MSTTTAFPTPAGSSLPGFAVVAVTFVPSFAAADAAAATSAAAAVAAFAAHAAFAAVVTGVRS